MKIPVHFPDVDSEIHLLLERGLLNTKIEITDTKGRYLHWDELRSKQPLPAGLTHEQWWAGMKYARRQMYKNINISDPKGKPFVFLYTDKIMKILHWLDQTAVGKFSLSQSILNSYMKNSYLTHSLVEEAICSSQLEGASTTRVVAKEMLRQNRKPLNVDEQMIYNNHAAMQFIKDYKQEKLTIPFLLELQKILTQNTLTDPKDAGCFRTQDDIHVVNYRGDIVYSPPPAQSLLSRMNQVCIFANEPNTESFIHPVIKSIILHFLLGYEHPFVDGNGRTARALFYWSMSQQDYWLMEYISISKMIKKAPVQYGKAYLYTETDENDLTYFIEHQLKIIKEAINDLYSYIDKEAKEIELAQSLFSSAQKLNKKLNYRQLALIKHAIVHLGYVYTIAEHQNSHAIAYDTARIDLSQLSDKLDLLIKEKNQKGFIFRVPKDLMSRIEKICNDS